MHLENKDQSHDMLSEINVTPFVDVMLVLLIIFMVTAPMLQQGIALNLPTAKTSGVKTERNPFILTIGKDQKIYIAKKEIPFASIELKLKAILKNRSSKQIYLKADRSVPYGFVAKTLAEIRASGFHQVSLITLSK